MNTIYLNHEEAPLFMENEGMLDAMLLDYQTFKLNTVWNSAEYIWAKFIRTN